MNKAFLIFTFLLSANLSTGQASFYEKYFRKIEVTEKIGSKTLSQHLLDSKIPAHFKTTFQGDGYNLNDDDSSLSIIDSLSSTDPERHPFYFVLVTRTLWWADGAFAQPLGMAVLGYVRERTDEFFTYFQNEEVLTKYDFNNWADQISMEIRIAHEGNEKQYIEGLRKELILNSPKHENNILEFVEIIKEYSP